MGKTRQSVPAARRDELVIQEVDGETLVYDLKSHKAHCLNQTSALVWKYCDGARTADEVALKVDEETGAKVSTQLVWMAVEQLEKNRLLKEPVERACFAARMSRREMARRLGIAAALALPLVTSINVQAAIQAASCLPGGSACTGPGQCCPGFACQGFPLLCKAT